MIGASHFNISSKALVLALSVTACSEQVTVDPDSTTYPANRTTSVTEVVNLPIPISIGVETTLSGGTAAKPVRETIAYSPGRPVLQGTINRTVKGDTAEEEIWIVPRNRSEFEERRLLARLNEGGRKVCGGDFRLKNTKFYFGPESTLHFLNITTPALSAIYRCPAQRLRVAGPDYARVDSLASQFRDERYFDILSFTVDLDPAVVRAKMMRVALELRMRVLVNSERNGSFEIVTSRPSAGPGRLPEHMAAVVRSNGDSSIVTLMHLSYQTTGHDRGVRGAGTYQPGFSREPQPAARNVAYEDARRLIQRIWSN